MATILERYVELHPASQQLHGRARRVFPDGVTHDMRYVQPFPIAVERAAGSRKWDIDGHEIVDFVMGHGALLLGHAHPAVTEAVAAQLARGTHYGASHELEVRWGELVQRVVPSVEHLRFTSSGTEATMMALRLARAHTGREKVLRLRDHFHGWNDSVTGQPPAEETLPRSPGLPHGILDASIVVPQNDIAALDRTMRESGGEIAAMIFEATGLHWGTEPIAVTYVRRARELTREHGVVLIFDEVITGFRVAAGGAQAAYGITPDMTTMAKIVAGGLPGGCVGGQARIVDRIAMRQDASERIAHPGTFNANPLSAAAGSACLAVIENGVPQQQASATARTLAQRLNAVFREEGVAGAVYGQASMLHIALGLREQPDDGYGWGWHAMPQRPPAVPGRAASALRRGMLNEGVDLMASGMMVSAVHTEADVDRTEEALRRTLRAMRAERLIDNGVA
ncbi:MAG: aminotransferase class III-fold pyridoxal phosphate-dependent enzyme [Dehalococcoidia bacterium]|nr:aminotransferase class III-fold pyridoxal phosphate-dependent enzyme [Dehalococcoidia bacterium]